MLIDTVRVDQFEDFIAAHEVVFIDFWAEWCAPCKQFATIYEDVAQQNKENKAIKFAKINVEEAAELAEMFQIQSIPHLMVFKSGIAIYSESGAIPESVLKELVEQALSADVSEIKDKIDKGEI